MQSAKRIVLNNKLGKDLKPYKIPISYHIHTIPNWLYKK
jgi:hypothetical protein